MSPNLRLPWLVLSALVPLAGCVDRTSAVGEQGRIEYSIDTDYEVYQQDLRQARIVTGHEQTLLVELTDAGRRDIQSLEGLQHRLTPSLHTHVETSVESVGGGARAFLTVQDPGAYTLESLLGGNVVDSVDLRFDRPAAFEVLVKVRPPWGDHFGDVGSAATIQVEEGSQLLLEAVPLDMARRRLAGALRPRVDIEPDWAVTPGVGVLEANEFGVWAVNPEMDFYLIEPGPLSFTFVDTVNAATSTQAFQVTPLAH